MTTRRGYSLVGLLVTLVCIVVLLSITLPAMRTATTGMNEDGTQAPNSAWGASEMMQLQALGQSLLTHGLGTGMDSMYPRPSAADGSQDRTLDTTANLYSLLVMERMTMPKQLVRKGDRGYVEVDTDYDWTTYSPRNHVYWDPSFVADLDQLSNVSYAHMPLTGRRVEDQWRTSMSSDFPLLGSRGPRDGIETIDSVTCPNGMWSGRVLFADGHVDFLQSTGAFNRRSRFGPDNLFTIDDLEYGSDAILGFTESIDEDGVTLQWD
jgi:type II secretory pathway pseudopilin PulG